MVLTKHLRWFPGSNQGPSERFKQKRTGRLMWSTRVTLIIKNGFSSFFCFFAHFIGNILHSISHARECITIICTLESMYHNLLNDFTPIFPLYTINALIFFRIKSCHYTENNGDKSRKNLEYKCKDQTNSTSNVYPFICAYYQVHGKLLLNLGEFQFRK